MPSTSTPATSATSAATQAQLDVFAKKQSEFFAQKAPLDAERMRLQALTNAQKTDEVRARISELDKQIATINTQLSVNSLAKSEVGSTTPDQIAAAKTKQTLLSSILETVPPPAPGLLSIIFPSSAAVKSADLMTYMTLTQHLNPYGRKRQCDTDLENLMGILNKDLLNSLGDNKSLFDALTALVKSVL